MISSVGRDEFGDRVMAAMAGLGGDDQYVRRDSEHTTGTVDVMLTATGQPSCRINEPVAYDFISLDTAQFVEIAAGGFDAFCYDTLIQRSRTLRETLYRLFDDLEGIPFFYDVNLRLSLYTRGQICRSLQAATIVKLNDEEAAVLAAIVFDREMEEATFAEPFAASSNSTLRSSRAAPMAVPWTMMVNGGSGRRRRGLPPPPWVPGMPLARPFSMSSSAPVIRRRRKRPMSSALS